MRSLFKEGEVADSLKFATSEDRNRGAWGVPEVKEDLRGCCVNII